MLNVSYSQVMEQVIVVNVQLQIGHARAVLSVYARQELVVNGLYKNIFILSRKILPHSGEQEGGGGKTLLPVHDLQYGARTRNRHNGTQEVICAVVFGLGDVCK